MGRTASEGSKIERCLELLTFDRTVLDGPTGRALFLGDPPPAAVRGLGGFPARLVGFDEAGRGAWAGPVAVGCVHFPPSLPERTLLEILAGVDDSKRLSPHRRAELAERIASCGRGAVGFASAKTIDRVGINEACRRAAARAYRRLDVDGEIGLFDRGLALDPSEAVAPRRCVQMTRGDSRSLHIAAASILAKTARDAQMERLDRVCPGYGLARHKGYGTEIHRQAILRLGASPLHRGTFLGGLRRAESQFC